MKKYDYVLVGSGLFAGVWAYLAAKQGKRCLVVEKRDHIGGNIYCEDIEGIHVHKYGAHIFHTSNRQVWEFVTGLAEFNRYTNSPVANYKGEMYNMPFNMNTFSKMWGKSTPAEAKAKIEEQRAGIAGEPKNLEEQAIRLVGRDIYEKLVKGYTEKQWGRDCKDLPAFIIKHLPVRYTYDNNYFNDDYQGIPVGGYNRLIDGLLQGCDVQTCIDFKDIQSTWRDVADKLVYTGAIDEYFDFSLGRLDWRTVSFETEVKETPNWQGNAVVNYTDHLTKFTRIIEHKHFESFGQAVYDNPRTVSSREYSTEYHPGKEPYYPVNDDRNNRLAKQYRQLAAQEADVIFGGRLAEYRYYDMAPVIAQAIEAWRKVSQNADN